MLKCLKFGTPIKESRLSDFFYIIYLNFYMSKKCFLTSESLHEKNQKIKKIRIVNKGKNQKKQKKEKMQKITNVHFFF